MKNKKEYNYKVLCISYNLSDNRIIAWVQGYDQ
jgi:hypothetical protein